MRINLEHRAAEIEETPRNQAKTDLSRRGLLALLPILGVGCAVAVTLGVREAGAATKPDAAGKAKDPAETNAAGKAKDLADDKPLAEGKRAESVGGRDPDDALEFSAQTPGMTRRQVRRTVRRERRATRRTARRVRRATRRGVVVP